MLLLPISRGMRMEFKSHFSSLLSSLPTDFLVYAKLVKKPQQKISAYLCLIVSYVAVAARTNRGAIDQVRGLTAGSESGYKIWGAS